MPSNEAPDERTGESVDSGQIRSGKQAGPATYDAFISYSRRDKAFADALHKALERYTTPKLEGIPTRRLRIFRDTEDLVGADYYQSIEHNLKSAGKMILICSPASAKSQFVNDEVKNFVVLKHGKDIIPVIVAGVPNNEAKPGQEDQCAFSPALCETLALPLAISYQGFDPQKNRPSKAPYEGSWYSILASLLNVSRAEIEAREKRRRRRQRTITAAVTGSVMLVLAALTVYAFLQRNEADRQAKSAVLERDRANTEATVAVSQKIAQAALLNIVIQPDLAALLSVEAANQIEAVGKPNDFEIRNALLSTVMSSPHLIGFLDHPSPVTSVAFGTNRRIVASGCGDGKIYLWDVASCQLLGEPLTGHEGDVLSVAFSPNGKLLASGGKDGSVRFWDAASSKLLNASPNKPKEEYGSVSRVAFSRDGKILVSGGDVAPLLIWDVETFKVLSKPLEGSVTAEWDFTADGKVLIILTGDGSRLLNLQTHELINVKGGAVDYAGFGDIGVTAINPDGTSLATAVGSGVWFQPVSFNGAGSKFRKSIPEPSPLKHSMKILGLAFRPDGKMLASSSRDSTISLWNMEDPSLRYSLINSTAYTRLDFSPVSLQGHSGPVNKLAFSSDGKLLASVGDDRKVALWDVASPLSSGRALDAAGPVGFRPDGSIVAKGAGGNWYMWDALGQRSADPLKGQGVIDPVGEEDRVVSSIAEIAAEIDRDFRDQQTGKVQLWTLKPRKRHGPPLEGFGNTIMRMAFSPDGKILAVGSSDKIIRLWDVASGQLVGKPLTGFLGVIESLAFDPGGTILAAGVGSAPDTDNDGDTNANAVHLWNIDKRLPYGQPISGYKSPAVEVAFSQDGRSLATWTDEDPVFLIALDNNSLKESLCRRANRNLSLAEWKRNVGDFPYRRTCPNLPPGEGAPNDEPAAQIKP